MQVDKKLIENILRANGVSMSSGDDEIKSLLFSARWHEDDIDTALFVLRNDANDNKQRIDAVYDEDFRLQDRMRPETISALLGIEVDDYGLDQKEYARGENVGTMGMMGMVFVLSAAIIFSGLVLLLFMFIFKIGVFSAAL
jgi:hypothetical protein